MILLFLQFLAAACLCSIAAVMFAALATDKYLPRVADALAYVSMAGAVVTGVLSVLCFAAWLGGLVV